METSTQLFLARLISSTAAFCEVHNPSLPPILISERPDRRVFARFYMAQDLLGLCDPFPRQRGFAIPLLADCESYGC